MAGSNSSIHGGNHGDGEPPISWAKMHHMANSLVEAMERMLDAHLPTEGGRGPHRRHEENPREESGDENSGFGHGFDCFGDCHGGHGGGHHADFDNQRGGHRAHGRRVRFEDEESEYNDHEGSYDDENPFAHGGRFERRHHHRRADFEDRNHHRGRRHRDDPDNIARVKLNIPKFTGKENADEYLEWAE